MSQMIAVAALVTVMLGAAAAIGGAGRWLWRVLRSVARLVDDLAGEPARGGMPERPGVLKRLAGLEDASRLLEELVRRRLDAIDERQARTDDRLAAIEAQLRKNGGDSLRDAVDRLQPLDTAA